MPLSFQHLAPHKLIFALLFILYLPLVLWGGYFIDDVRRAVFGQYAWSTDYRPVIDLMYYLLGQGMDFIDLYPLNYVLQFAVLYVFLQYASQQYLEKLQLEPAQLNYLILALFFLFCQPFFIQNLYFRYDSLPMVLSVVWISLPFVLKRTTWWLDFSLVLLVLLTYQPTVVGYVILTCLELIILAKRHTAYPQILAFLSAKVVSLLAAFVVFKLIASYLLTPNPYAEHHFEILTFAQADKLLENILHSLQNLVFSSSLTDQVIVGLMMLLALIYMAKVLVTDYSHKIGVLFLLAIVFVVGLSLLNPNIVLYYPRLYSRVYVGVGFFSFFVVVLLILSWVVEKNIKYQRICQFLIFYVLLLNINISYASFNAMKEMQRHEAFVMQSIMHDLSGIKEVEHIEIYGAVEKTNVYRALTSKYSIIDSAMETKINMNKHLYAYFLLQNAGYDYGRFIYKDVTEKKARLDMVLQHEPYLDKRLYNFYYIDSNVFIVLKQQGELPDNIIHRTRLN